MLAAFYLGLLVCSLDILTPFHAANDLVSLCCLCGVVYVDWYDFTCFSVVTLLCLLLEALYCTTFCPLAVLKSLRH